jgi:hypothetical protein
MGKPIMSTTGNFPECGFRENTDGSIVWGSRWDRDSAPAPVCIVYHFEDDCGAWIPFTAWTRDPQFVALHDLRKEGAGQRRDRDLAQRFDVSDCEMHQLCEEAGYP